MEDKRKQTHAATAKSQFRHCLGPTGRFSLVLCATSLVAGALFGAGPAMAQGETAESAALAPASGLVVTPFVSMETIYDSNIFATPSPTQSDTILRLSPGIGVAYKSARSTFNLLYTFDSERFSRHPRLNSWQTRQDALIGGTYAFTERFNGGITANYLESQYPGQLTPFSGVEIARTRAERVSIRPTATYQFNPRTSATFFYDRSREHIAGGLTTYTSIASAALIRDLTPRDQLTLQYQNYWYAFSTGTNPISRLFSIGWTHAVSRDTSFFLTAGPRDTDGQTVADVYTGIRRDSGKTFQSLFYRRSQVTLAGQSGVYNTYGLEAPFGFRPTPRWTISAIPGYYRVSQTGKTIKVYRLALAGRYWFARDWSLAFSYSYSHQRGVFIAPFSEAPILHNVISLSLTWALPSGPGHASLPFRRAYGLSSTESRK